MQQAGLLERHSRWEAGVGKMQFRHACFHPKGIRCENIDRLRRSGERIIENIRDILLLRTKQPKQKEGESLEIGQIRLHELPLRFPFTLRRLTATASGPLMRAGIADGHG